MRETVCELANMVIGNAITSLNDQGFRFKISPPEVHTAEQGLSGSEETEALVMCFETHKGSVYMNIAMHYNRRRKEERSAAVVA
ncbi:MAG TPA: chemotaxis protein CheC [Candidatus Dormibacteraeota bacterium]|nr:chemotaxis protein CheC [Candidatus Dormibacteraeota bacterium]